MFWTRPVPYTIDLVMPESLELEDEDWLQWISIKHNQLRIISVSVHMLAWIHAWVLRFHYTVQTKWECALAAVHYGNPVSLAVSVFVAYDWMAARDVATSECKTLQPTFRKETTGCKALKNTVLLLKKSVMMIHQNQHISGYKTLLFIYYFILL